jgi:hypothetical protein
MIFAFKKETLQKPFIMKKKPFPYFQFVSWINSNNKPAGTKPEKPGGKQWL